VEISLGVFFGSGKFTKEPLDETNMTYIQTSLGALGKYPFSINKNLSVFPLLGIDCLAAVSVKENGVEFPEPKSFNSLWLKAGGGMDLALSSHLYIRLDALYGLRFPTKFEIETFLISGLIGLIGLGPFESSQVRLGHGPTVKLALGYRF
jgi:hypothetical protein